MPGHQHRDLRSQILDELLERIRREHYPSTTMLDLIESKLHQDERPAYAQALWDKVGQDIYPSMDLLRRLHAFI